MARITIGGMGTASIEHMTLKTHTLLLETEKIFLRTEIHKSAAEIRKIRPDSISFDAFYEKYACFEEVYDKISDEIIACAEKHAIMYLVPGSAVFAEKSVELLVQKAQQKNISVEILPSVSFVDAVFATMQKDAAHNSKLLDALTFDVNDLDSKSTLLISQVYDSFIASDVKLKLLDYYGAEKKVCVIKEGGEAQAQVLWTTVGEMDRSIAYDHMSSVYLLPDEEVNLRDYRSLAQVMKKLRGKNGCNWDKAQDHESLKKYLIEECYEVIDAIDQKDFKALCEELGDVLLQIYFHANIADEEGFFDIRDVYEGINKKMITRHPHIFESRKDLEAEEVKDAWEEIKRKEKGQQNVSESLKAIPKALPALVYANRLQDKAGRAGFDFDSMDQIYDKIREETEEFIACMKANNEKTGQKEEIGDWLFSIVNLARFLKIDSEDALKSTSQKFLNRFSVVEELALSDGYEIKALDMEKADLYWEKAKKILKEKIKDEKK